MLKGLINWEVFIFRAYLLTQKFDFFLDSDLFVSIYPEFVWNFDWAVMAYDTEFFRVEISS